MAFSYHSPPTGPLRQGEIIGPVVLNRANIAAIDIPTDFDVQVKSVLHNKMIVLHADCDLEQDFHQRDENGNQNEGCEIAKLIPEILICDLFEDSEIKVFTPSGAKDFRRVRQNQNERFHCINSASIMGTETTLPQLFMDFKRSYMEAPENIYKGISGGQIGRLAVIPPVYIHDLMHRYFGFQSRVGLPE